MNSCRFTAPGLAIALLVPATAAAAPAAERTPKLATVQVVATRVEQPAANIPAAVSVVEGAALERPGLGVNLSEKLQEVPGVLARERQNFAQDLQVSVRGFGARATFGIRGIRLFLDGIPATMPDGQGQVSNFNLASAGRIEVLRGPFSALYGNAAGGVIQLHSANGADAPGTRLALAAGADDVQRQTLDFRGGDEGFDWLLDATRFRTGGYREHSAAGRDLFNARLKFARGDSRLVLVANALESPESQDPLGLSADQMDSDPRQATAAAHSFDTRKSVRHRQLGAVLEHDFESAGTLRLQVHGGERRIVQFLSVPVGAQSNPLSGGGVVDLDSRFEGIDARWSTKGDLAGRPFELVLGVDADRQRQHRLGFENFQGTRTGVRGELRRDQVDLVANSDLYSQATWQLSDATLLMAGVRRSRVRFRSEDRYVTGANPDDSGRVDYSAITPAFGASHRVGTRWTLYASAGRGFETPTFDELGYRPDGSAGLNFGLLPARTRNVEAGARARFDRGGEVDLTLFRADSGDELAVASNSGGRSTYRNIGRARRQGVELYARWPIASRWQASAAATWLDASYRDAFLACAGTPCPAPTVPVPAGADIPGVPRSMLSLALDWSDGSRWGGRLAARHVASVSVDSARSVRAPAYTVLDAEATLRFRALGAGTRAFLRVDNLLDRLYAGSVIVNEANGRYFEPAPGRTLLAGLDLRW